MRIVIIEDELLIVKTMTAVLTAAGHIIVGKAGSLANGLRLIEEAQFDKAIIDINLDGVSAEPLCKQLSERRIPALLISGYSQAQLPGWAKNAHFLSKPFAPDALLTAIAVCKTEPSRLLKKSPGDAASRT